MSKPSASVKPRTRHAAPEPAKDGFYQKAGKLFALGGGLLLAASIVLAIGLGSWASVAVLWGGLIVSFIAVMAGIIIAASGMGGTESRFHWLKLAGLLAIPGGVALGLATGGLLGVGLMILGLAVSVLLFGVGVVAGGR